MSAVLSEPLAIYGAARPGPLALIVQGFRDLWSRRRLARYLVQADLTKTGANTLLGNIWWVMDPLLQMAVYVVFVQIIVGNKTPDYPLFVFAAILPWKWFSSGVNDAILSILSQERIIKQVAFPKIVLPTAATVSGIVSFAFGMIPLVALIVLFYSDRLSPTLLLIPAVAIVQFVFTLAVAIVLSALNVFYRDVGNLMRHVLRLWFYLSPALYTQDQVAHLSVNHPELATLYGLNPFAVILEAYHAVIFYGTQPDWQALGGLLGVSLILLAVAILIFKRVEPAFAKVL
ncbi:MAG TPA: ABC transporter permease [Candidatus Sulfotelmatobacter sp.]|nr:ABC transporter permease [Candidatus Sulfotelmatobacter sp.]